MGISPSPRPSHTHTPYDIHKAEKGDGRWAHAYTRVPVVRSEDNVDKGHGAGQGESTRLWSGPRTTLTRDNVSYELTVTVPCVSRTSSRMFTFTRHMRSPPKPVSAGPVSPSHASLERAFRADLFVRASRLTRRAGSRPHTTQRTSRGQRRHMHRITYPTVIPIFSFIHFHSRSVVCGLHTARHPLYPLQPALSRRAPPSA